MFVRYLKVKWKLEREGKGLEQRNVISKGITPITSMLEQGRQHMREAVWQIVKVSCCEYGF